MTEADDSIEEKRVYGGKAGGTDLLVAAGIGVVRASVAGGRLGGFGVVHRCSPRDVAAGPAVAVATDDDVLVGDGFGETGFGPAVAVGFDDGALLAAAPGGRIARYDGPLAGNDPADGGAGWTDAGAVDDEVRAIDGDLLATAGGVYRLAEGPAYAGLSDARDVSAVGRPLAATGDGLYALGNGWMDALEGDFRAVASDGERAHAATADALYGRRDGEWRAVDLPVDEPVVDVAYGGCPYAVTAEGTLLSDPGAGDGGWRSHPLGVPGVVGLAIP